MCHSKSSFELLLKIGLAEQKWKENKYFVQKKRKFEDLHLQQMMQGAATRRTGEAKTRRIPNPAKIPITCNINLHDLLDLSFP